MHYKFAPIMMINLTRCTNLPSVMDLVGIAWESGFKATGHTSMDSIDDQDIWCIALPGNTVGSNRYRKLAAMIGLLSDDNLGPMLIESDGLVFMTNSTGPYPVTAPCGYIGNGPGLFTITVDLDNGSQKVYHIDPEVEERDKAGCWIDY